MTDYKGLIGTQLMSKQGLTSSEAALNSKVVGIYFSAHWCGPCRQFTPMLIEFYKNFKSMDAPFEIIFVSSDSSQQEFNNYYKDMPWLAIPFGDERIELLNNAYEIQGIPTLILVNPQTGEMLSADGRELIMEGGENQILDWCFS